MSDLTRPTTAELITWADEQVADMPSGDRRSPHIERLRAHRAALAADLRELEAVRAACDAVASDNIGAIVGEDAVSRDLPRWVILNDDGEPMLTADSPAALIRGMKDKWAEMSDLCERQDNDLYLMRKKLAAVRRGDTVDADLRELQRLRAAVADVRLLDENPPAMSDAPRHWNNGEACAWLDGYGAGVADAIKPLTRALDHGGADGAR